MPRPPPRHQHCPVPVPCVHKDPRRLLNTTLDTVTDYFIFALCWYTGCGNPPPCCTAPGCCRGGARCTAPRPPGAGVAPGGGGAASCPAMQSCSTVAAARGSASLAHTLLIVALFHRRTEKPWPRKVSLCGQAAHPHPHPHPSLVTPTTVKPGVAPCLAGGHGQGSWANPRLCPLALSQPQGCGGCLSGVAPPGVPLLPGG